MAGASNARVFLEFSAEAETIGRVVIELFNDVVPRTADNFRALCTGESLAPDGTRLWYKGSRVHRVIPGFVLHGGDITHGNGTGGLSVYGPTFGDENFRVRHSTCGIVSMSNRGPNTNASQFFITLAPSEFLDGQHVAFGKVLSGFSVLSKLEQLGSAGGRPVRTITISDCGLAAD